MSKNRPTTSPEILEDRITPAPVFAQFNLLSDINGTNGFTLTGTGATGANVEIEAVANAGDVNDDGFPDLLVGIPFDSSNSKGRAAIVFGHAGGFPTNLNLDSLGSAGVLMLGETNFDFFGKSVAGLGDVNGDGIDDFVIGAPGSDGTVATERGAAYVVFGRATWGATLALSTLNGTDGNGFKIVGDARRTGVSGIAQAVGGYNLAGAGAGGDFNNDGFDDILIGAQDIKAFAAGGNSSGAAFIIFGKNTKTSTGGTAFTSPFSVGTLDGTNSTGLMIGSTTGNNFMGSEVGFVGDVNQDGFTDVSLGNIANPQTSMRTSYVIFGHATPGGALPPIILESLTPAQGFQTPATFDVPFKGFQYYGSEFVLRDIDNDGDQDLGVSFATTGFAGDPPILQGYTFVKNKGTGYTTNPFGNLSTELRQGLLGHDNTSVTANLYDLGDFNGDGYYDIASYPPYVTDSLPDVFHGRAPTKTYIANNGTNSTGVSFTGLFNPVGGDDPQIFFIGDVSGDGIDDVLVIPSDAASSVNTAPNAYIVFGNAINPSADGKTVVFRDVDGDTVTVKTSAGALTQKMFKMSHPPGSVQTGQQLDLLDLTIGDANADAAFSLANLTISVKKAATGDGKVNVGAINATGIDLGNVVIAGGLGSIDAGNGTDFEKPGLNKLDLYRFGGVGVPSSDIVGRIGSIVVDTEFEAATLNITGTATEGLGSIAIGNSFSGKLNIAGPLGTFKSHDMIFNAKIDADGASTKKTTITAKSIANGTIIDLATTLGKLSATEIGTATITALRIDTISVTGDTKAAIPGAFAATIHAPNGLGTITVKENFSGNLDLVGALATLGTFKSYDMLTGAIINVDGASTKKTSITAHVINNGVSIDVASVIGKLSAAKIGDAAIIADRIDSLSVTGDTKNIISGDLAADITLDNAGATGDVKALGTAKIAGLFHDAKIIAAGSIGSFSAGAMQTASLFAGYTPTNAAQPLNGGNFLADALLGTFTITGKAEITGGITTAAGTRTAMDDSFVIATALGSSSIASLDDQTGALAWGFASHTTLKSLKVKEPVFTYDTDTGGQQGTNDFSVRTL